jgi:hypothetical protein
LLAYLAAALVGGTVFAGVLMLTAGEGMAPISFAILMQCVVALVGAIVALPIAAPIVIMTEKWGQGPWWVFFVAGLAVAALVASIQFWFFGAELRTMEIGGLLLLAAPPAAAMTFWFIAWHRNPPKQTVAPLAEVFE